MKGKENIGFQTVFDFILFLLKFDLIYDLKKLFL